MEGNQYLRELVDYVVGGGVVLFADYANEYDAEKHGDIGEEGTILIRLLSHYSHPDHHVPILNMAHMIQNIWRENKRVNINNRNYENLKAADDEPNEPINNEDSEYYLGDDDDTIMADFYRYYY